MQREPSAIETLALLTGDRENAERARLPLGIEAQRIDGQMRLVESAILPRDLRPSRGVFEQAGFKLGRLFGGIFLEAELPDGWAKRATSDPSHTDILDDRRRLRGTIYFNAAFHERDAHATLLCRYRVLSVDVNGDGQRCEVLVWDHSEERSVHSSGTAHIGDADVCRRLLAEARNWIETRIPVSDNPLAHW